MVKYKVRLTNYAIKQFENIIDYTLDVLQSPDSASKLADALELNHFTPRFCGEFFVLISHPI